MSKILKFPKRHKSYSDNFLKNVKPDAIGDFIREQNPHLTLRAADAMALAIIYSTYLSLVFEEEGEQPCLLYTSPSPRDGLLSRMPSSA